MRTPIVRSILAFTLAAIVLSPTAGCGKEKRAKECISQCEQAKADCARRKDKECAEHESACRHDCSKL